jgi:mRNA-degrading endonuclease RelE of RelBE toxin-antitoxin system
MTYTVTFTKKARKHVVSFERSGNEALCQKIDNLLLELAEHPEKEPTNRKC